MSISMAMQSPSSSSLSYEFTYDVFLNFRGIDTRLNFAGNLYKALTNKGIRTFFDDNELQGGDEIKPSLVNAIEKSRIFVPVFSINYASSSFCLDELVHIIDCFNEKGRLVLPVFYGIDPSHVRHQDVSYGEAIAKHIKRFENNKQEYNNNMERLQKWKLALNQAANLCGHHFNGNQYEYKFIGKIVEEISNKINRDPLYVADYPVGLESQVLQVKSLLNDERSGHRVHMVGLYGTGGIGKTTLARATYNLIADQFECLCFLHNVREISAKHGVEHLQECFLSNTIKLNTKVGHFSEGVSVIKRTLQEKKVLLILDDVDELKQLEVMVGGLDWFGYGSRVIITTRDQHLLKSHGIKRTYEVVGLNEGEALDLLRWKAFKNDKVDSSYDDILNCAVTYACGLPLALEVVGSNLFGKDIEEWKSCLLRYKRFPNKDILKILKVSFDALEEDEQSVFLDIASCYRGYDLRDVKYILNAHYGYNMIHQIGRLVEKSLIKISQFHSVTLHDLIVDMGKDIVRRESPKDPGKRSRLWFHEDIVQVLEENTGTSKIEIIHLDCPLIEVVVHWNGKAFSKMKNLKTLIIRSGYFSQCPSHLPGNLRVLEWHGYPSQRMPFNFYPKRLAICRLPDNSFTSLELTSFLNKKFVNLIILNLDNSEYLTNIPDVSSLNLEKLSFKYCKNLITIHDSVGSLNKLKLLNAEGCSKLKSFPALNLTSLEELRLSFCKNLERFPEILGEMDNICAIKLFETSIEELPLSFRNLTGLDSLQILGNGILRLSRSIYTNQNLSYALFRDCHILPIKDDSIMSPTVSSNIQYLKFSGCNLSNELLPTILTLFANVREIDISKNDFTILPECLEGCFSLRRLNMDDCKYLQEIRGIPLNLEFLSACHCKSLTSSSISMLLNQVLHGAGARVTRFILPVGTERIRRSFEYQSKGTSLSFWFRNKIPSIAFFISVKSVNNWSPLDEHLDIKTNLVIDGDDELGPYYNLVPVKDLDHKLLCNPQLQHGKFKKDF